MTQPIGTANVENPRKCMICGYGRYCNNCQANGDNHKAMFPLKSEIAEAMLKKAETGDVSPNILADAALSAIHPHIAKMVEALEEFQYAWLHSDGHAGTMEWMSSASDKTTKALATLPEAWRGR